MRTVLFHREESSLRAALESIATGAFRREGGKEAADTGVDGLVQRHPVLKVVGYILPADLARPQHVAMESFA